MVFIVADGNCVKKTVTKTMNELEKILAVDESKSKPVLEGKPQAEPQAKQDDEEVLRKKEQLDNLNRAIEAANKQLKEARVAQSVQKKDSLEEDIPKINFEDPSARAWDKHIGEKVNPLQSELEKEKEEIRTFALQEFLADKPALAKNPDKVKELVSMYERIRTATERTKEGVQIDLDKAYAAINHVQLLSMARQRRLAKATEDELFSNAAVSRGATAYQEPKESSEPLSDEDKLILSRWGIDPKEWQDDKKKYG